MLANPVISDWTSLVASPSGVLFGKPLTAWRESARKQLGLSEKPHIVVGHQPEFFHPGILAKFIAGSHIAKEVNGTLVHLVVDHHFGVSGTIEIPNQEGRYVTSSTVEIAPLITGVAMKDQPRVIAGTNDAFSTALNQAEGSNAAMQFARTFLNPQKNKVLKVLKVNAKIRYDNSKPDGTPQKLLDISVAKKYGWKPKVTLEKGILMAYNSFIKSK